MSASGQIADAVASVSVDDALAEVERGAAQRDVDASPSFPRAAVESLRRAGLLAFNAIAGCPRPPAKAELGLVRRVATADASLGRIFDGHLNAIERLAVHGPVEVRDRELAQARRGELWAGVWGGEPRVGEGTPARVEVLAGQKVLSGVKTFCSGAGGLHRALVLAVDHVDPGRGPVAVWIDVSDPETVEVDELWYRSHGLVASASHRVIFHDAPVIAQFGAAGTFAQQPWFGRDALRTAATWAGIGDSAARAALRLLVDHGRGTELEELAAGRIASGSRALDVWMDYAALAMDAADPELPSISVQVRVAIADACRSVLDEAARACGSWPFVRGDALDRARRDLGVFLLQHRMDPLVARLGSTVLAELGASRGKDNRVGGDG